MIGHAGNKPKTGPRRLLLSGQHTQPIVAGAGRPAEDRVGYATASDVISTTSSWFGFTAIGRAHLSLVPGGDLVLPADQGAPERTGFARIVRILKIGTELLNSMGGEVGVVVAVELSDGFFGLVGWPRRRQDHRPARDP